ncbi:MAG: dicarboxylate/amino acid:cation symporter [Lentisphaerae bacterium]|nr:dicarboxylate/amino acid:cation symporter [Lentisphaerota bacterium]
MNLFSVVIILMILGFVVAGVSALRSGRGEGRCRRILRIAAVFFLVYGALAFFVQALCASGGLSFLRSSFEWPLATVSGVVRDSVGDYIAPHPPSGRVQVYDRDKRFLLGWTVDAGGGVFKLSVTDDDSIEVFTARGNRHYVFTLAGDLVSQSTYGQQSYSDLGRSAETTENFQTPIFLLPFSHPFAGWTLGALGMVGLIVLDKTKKGKRHRTTVSNATSG